jgi:hypothetical protein
MSSENYAGSMQKSDGMMWMKMCATVDKEKPTHHRKFGDQA